MIDWLNAMILEITVCHYPPGTSKWNRIEHRLFSFITMGWSGRPLTDIRTIVELIRATKTRSGRTVGGWPWHARQETDPRSRAR